MHSLFFRFPRVLVFLLGLAVLCGSLSSSAGKSMDTYDYLAIGNSITRHPECEYWWNDVGMAASDESKDYFHIVTAFLQEQHENVISQAIHFVEWEVADSNAREKAFRLIDPYLTEDLDLITLQLSENAAYSRALGRDYEQLIRHIKEKCPQADILLIDDFWSDAKHSVKKKAAEKLGLPFVDLSYIRGNPAFQWTVGDVVFGSDGQPHNIENPDVARHPNDLGMAYIGWQIIWLLEALP